MSAMSPSFIYKPHLNTPMAVFCGVIPAFVYSEGGRMRWGAIFSGVTLYCMFGFSSVMWVDFRDLQSSSEMGMAASAGFIAATYLTNFLPVHRFVPKRVCLGVGSAYFLMHAYGYADAQRQKWPEVEED
uniref:Uncharacterized protein n=1 Tax=Neobodo designis TaxID=312471 RepID=A0A7S1QEP1_NEODS|mmetsp:Transcript_41549/g.128383  ORF Transcript_41549/g.128383 Transcript_41549/m.128383 type:complete len:129 (+) Transcript_41549:35-421(+)